MVSLLPLCASDYFSLYMTYIIDWGKSYREKSRETISKIHEIIGWRHRQRVICHSNRSLLICVFIYVFSSLCLERWRCNQTMKTPRSHQHIIILMWHHIGCPVSDRQSPCRKCVCVFFSFSWKRKDGRRLSPNQFITSLKSLLVYERSAANTVILTINLPSQWCGLLSIVWWNFRDVCDCSQLEGVRVIDECENIPWIEWTTQRWQ